jgi:hypothetical protein
MNEEQDTAVARDVDGRQTTAGDFRYCGPVEHLSEDDLERYAIGNLPELEFGPIEVLTAG